jgi:hypothetical protein
MVFSTALVSFTGQNIGAGKYNRVKSGLSKSIPESDPKFYAILVSTLKKSLGKKNDKKRK